LIEREAEGLSVKMIRDIHKALKTLAGMSEVDRAIARTLAGYSALTARQAVLGAKVLERYRNE
jgi:hypothetical protein